MPKAKTNYESSICLNCGMLVTRKPRRKIQKFCSFACSCAYRSKGRSEKQCPMCGKLFGADLSPAQLERAMYCSRTCSNHRTFNPTTTRYHSTSVNGKSTPVHRAVMEAHLGRRLSTSEFVHHINGDKQDNRLENLEVMDPKSHAVHHLQKHPMQKPCVVCGVEFTPHKTKRVRAKTCGAESCKHTYKMMTVPNRKLDSSDIAAIRARRGNGEKLATLASEFGVSMSTVSAAALGSRHYGNY